MASVQIPGQQKMNGCKQFGTLFWSVPNHNSNSNSGNIEYCCFLVE
jgi:hypothetical protein